MRCFVSDEPTHRAEVFRIIADERPADCCSTGDSRDGTFDLAILGGGSAAKQLSLAQHAIHRGGADRRDVLIEHHVSQASIAFQGMLEMKIARLQEIVRNTQILDETKMDSSKVQILSKIKIKNLKNKAAMVYTIVSEAEADLKEKKISVSSPIAKGLLGKKVGDKTKIQVPNGIMEFEIVDISR